MARSRLSLFGASRVWWLGISWPRYARSRWSWCSASGPGAGCFDASRRVCGASAALLPRLRVRGGRRASADGALVCIPSCRGSCCSSRWCSAGSCGRSAAPLRCAPRGLAGTLGVATIRSRPARTSSERTYQQRGRFGSGHRVLLHRPAADLGASPRDPFGGQWDARIHVGVSHRPDARFVYAGRRSGKEVAHSLPPVRRRVGRRRHGKCFSLSGPQRRSAGLRFIPDRIARPLGDSRGRPHRELPDECIATNRSAGAARARRMLPRGWRRPLSVGHCDGTPTLESTICEARCARH
jgi:hypothetical protein